MSAAKKFGLGRGLEALLGEDDVNFDVDTEIENITDNSVFKGEINKEIAIDSIIPCSFQPRTEFDAEALESLSQSIKEKGVLQPLLLRRKDEKYEIVAGERRWRAAKLAGLQKVPAIIKNFNDAETLEIALIENLQRENLSAIEEANGLNNLLINYGYTQEELGKVVSKSRSYIANAVRLLSLPKPVQQMVQDNKISAGHARCLVGRSDAEDLAKKIWQKGLSVRETEQLLTAVKNKKKKALQITDYDVQQIIKDLEQKLKLKVQIKTGKKGKGSVTLKYNNPSELGFILDVLEQR